MSHDADVIEGEESVESILALRKLTRVVAEHMRSLMVDYLGTLSPLLRARAVFGDYARGGSKDGARRSDKAFKELQGLYDAIAPIKPFNLPREFATPFDVHGPALEVTPFEYAHVVATGSQTRVIAVRAPLTWVLSFTDASPARLRELLDAKQRSVADLQRLVLSTLALHVTVQSQPNVVSLLDALGFSVSHYATPEFGGLPLTRIATSISSRRPADSIILQSAELTGMDAFEEVLQVADLVRLRHPLKERLLDIARASAPGLVGGASSHA